MFNSELYCWINAINMIQKYLFIGLFGNEQTIVLLFQIVPYASWPQLDLAENPLELLQLVHKTYFGKSSKYCADRTLKVQ